MSRGRTGSATIRRIRSKYKKNKLKKKEKRSS